MLNYCGRLLKTPVKTVTATASLLCFLSPVASEQPSGSSVSRGEAVPQLPEFLFSLQWHRPARHLLCDRQTQNWRHDALVPECLVSKDSRNHTDTCKAVYCPFKLCNRALTLYKCPIQDEPVHHSDRQRYRQRKDAAESQSDWTAQRYRKRFSCTHTKAYILSWIVVSTLLCFSGTTPICDDIGRHILNYGRRIPLAEWDARIDVSRR